MIFITAILINFSILLKSSVSDYVENLRHETKFEFMYNVQSDQETYPDTEMLRNYRLSDDNGILQTVYLLNANSKYYDIRNDDVVVTKAFSEKYNYKVGDKIKLSDRVSNKDLYFKIDRISNNNTNSEVYINNTLIEELEGINSFNTIVLSNKRLKDSQNIISVITKNEIVKSGKNILNIINKQISMILVIAIVVEITLMYSLIRFIYENNYSSMKVYYLLGFSKKDIYRFHFSLNIPISIVLIASGYALNLIIVRKFLDNIMYTFSNYVVVSNNIHSFAVTTLLIFIVYLLFILSFRIKLQKEDFK
jgi:efflux ABC transporter, permease protein